MRPAARFESIQLSLIRQINQLAGPDSLNLGLGEPNLEPDDHLRSLMERAAREASWHYSEIPGSLALREAISRTMPDNPDPATEICATAGSQEGLWAIFQAFIGPGDEVLVPDPGFVSYPALTSLAGGTPVPYPLDPDDWSIDLDSLADLITPSTKLLIVNTPSNPTGRSIPAGQLEAICELASEHDFHVVSDEVYREIYYTPERPPSLAGRSDRVVVVTSVSKSHGLTGLRLGWITAREELMSTIRKAHHYTTTCASTYAQKLVELILEDQEWNDGWLERVRRQLTVQREAALSALSDRFGHPITPEPDGAFYLFAPVPSCNTLDLAKELAARYSVLVIPGVAFGKRGEGYLRVSYAADATTIREGVERLAIGVDAVSGGN